jgi:ribosomal protein S18 acetylase RimI-like enzyme
MNAALRFRQCIESDRDWAYALKSEAYRDVVERQFGPWDEKFQQTLFAKRWNPATSMVIILGEDPVGLFSVERKGRDIHLDEIQVACRWQNRGIGTAVVQRLIEESESSVGRISLQVLIQNTRAAKLYERLGFRVVGDNGTHKLMERDSLLV